MDLRALWEQMRLLTWLGWKLQWRMLTASSGRVVGLVLVTVLFAPFALIAAVGVFFAAALPAPDARRVVLILILTFVYLYWLLRPLLYAMTPGGETFDLTRLVHYPVSVRRLFAGSVLASFCALGMLAVWPSVLALLAGSTTSLVGFTLAAVTIGLFLFHTLGLAQAFGLAAAGALRSRRLRDAGVVVGGVLAITIYTGTQLVGRSIERGGHWNMQAVIHHRAWDYLALSPPGMAASALVAAGTRHYLQAVLPLLGLIAASLVTVWVAGRLVDLVAGGYEFGRRRRRPEHEEAVPAVAVPALSRPSLLERLVGPIPAAVADKEIKYLRRDPTAKRVLLATVYIFVVFVFTAMRSAGMPHGSAIGGGMVFLMVLMMEQGLLFNMLGLEGSTAAMLLLTPAPRRSVLVGKGVVYAGVALLVDVPYAAMLAVLHLPYVAAALTWVVLELPVMLAVGNLVSVLAPWHIRGRGNGLQGLSFDRLVIQAGFLLLGIPLAVPTAGAVLIPLLYGQPAWYAISLPLALAYGIACYLYSLRLADRLLSGREPAVVAALASPD